MPTIRKCPACRKSLRLGDDSAGKQVRCPSCRRPFTVPPADEPEPQQEDTEDRQTDDNDVEDRPRPSRRSSDGKDRPRRKAGKRGSKKGLIIGLSVGGGALVVGLVVLLIFLLGGVGRDNPNATEDNFDKIKAGMTREEVEKFLGPGEKVSRAEVFTALHDPVPKEGVGSDTLTLKWRNKTDTILLEILPPPMNVTHGWFVREQGGGRKPKYKLLGFGKLQ